jgi:hypothetical protein
MANVRIDQNGVPKGPIVDPVTVAAHRTDIAAAEGATPPAANNSAWAANPGGYAKARVFAYVDFTGGTNPYVVVRPWLRSGGTSGKVGKGEAVTITGDDQVAIDVDVDGDDLLVYVESVSGSPTSFDVDLSVSWR